ncbi:unnamed protein product [Schistosoma turkestanicum]|nr:unnamed protein product [Schistosoma turkestanicum]
MEPPPRLYTYKGLFTESRSLDLTLKIVSTLLSFLVFLFLIAWRISRKHYNNSPIDKRLNFRSFDDLCQNGASCLTSSYTYRRKKSPLVRGYFDKQEVLFVEDRELISLCNQFPLLDLHFSLAPKSFRRKWCGLMIADGTLQFRSELNELMLLAFNSLPIKIFERIGHLGADPQSLGSILISNNNCATFENRLDIWICSLYSEIFFFGPLEIFCETTSDNTFYFGKEQFISDLRECIISLESLHIHGDCTKKSNVFETILKPFLNNNTSSYNTDKLITIFHRLINPLIHYYLDKSLNNETIKENINNSTENLDSLQISEQPTNLLLQLIITHHYLKEEGSSNEFLTLTHIIHLLSECCLITRYSMNKTLKILLTILAIKPTWQDNVKKECKQFLEMQYNYYKTQKFTSLCNHPPSHLCMSLEHTKCLVWTKALVQETMRLCMPGWPFGSLRQALRDGKILEHDFREGELVFLDESSYYLDPDLWTADEIEEGSTKIQPQRVFDPNRFIKKLPDAENSRTVELNLPEHWVQNVFQRYAVCVPHQFIYFILTTALVHLFGTAWESYPTDEQIKPDYSDDFLIWSNDLPKVDLRINFP